ncbi:MAG: hypothetical protein M3P18_01830, partial [Actinomycetota bacterium]|nr:hypothetical protein [Actinomycetota bacterium]
MNDRAPLLTEPLHHIADSWHRVQGACHDGRSVLEDEVILHVDREEHAAIKVRRGLVVHLSILSA